MGSKRVHIVLSAQEHARYRAQAEREEESLSEWLRGAARDRLAAAEGERLRTVDDLDAFFARCDEVAGDDREPDWEEHLRVIGESRPRTAT